MALLLVYDEPDVTPSPLVLLSDVYPRQRRQFVATRQLPSPDPPVEFVRPAMEPAIKVRFHFEIPLAVGFNLAGDSPVILPVLQPIAMG